ncbi:MAG: tripartite tricarboxylate transporter TctB family protein [Pseudomonadota bacterium]
MHTPLNRPAGWLLAGRAQDFYLGVLIAVAGVLLLVWIIPAQVNDAGSFGLPPSLAPRALSWVMILCGVMLALQNMRNTQRAGKLAAREVLFLVACLGAVGGMLLLMRMLSDAIDQPNAGFLLSAPLGVIALTVLHSRAPLWAYAFNALVAPLVIVAAFWWGLELPLP